MDFEGLSTILFSHSEAEDFKSKKELPLEKAYQLLLKPQDKSGSCSCPVRGTPLLDRLQPWEVTSSLEGLFTFPG